MKADLTPRHIAKDFMIGNTRVKIATDYCENVTPEEVERILARIARRALPALIAAERAKMQKKGD